MRSEEVEGKEPVRSVDGDELEVEEIGRDCTLEREGATLRSHEPVEREGEGEGGRVRWRRFLKQGGVGSVICIHHPLFSVTVI